jgi:hypothetical protein
LHIFTAKILLCSNPYIFIIAGISILLQPTVQQGNYLAENLAYLLQQND